MFARRRKLLILSRSSRPLWTPDSLGADLKAWWDADDHGTARMTDDGLGLISSWTDRVSGIAVTGTLGARPTWGAAAFPNSKAGLTFDGVANTLRTTSFAGLPVGSTPGEIHVLATGTTTGRILCDYGTGVATLRRLYMSGSTVRASDGSINSAGTGPVWNGPAIAGAIFGPTTVDARMNGADQVGGTGATLNTGTTRFAIGSTSATTAASFWVGATRHVLVTLALSAANRLRLEGYLAWDSGLNALLPSTHPYVNHPPQV